MNQMHSGVSRDITGSETSLTSFSPQRAKAKKLLAAIIVALVSFSQSMASEIRGTILDDKMKSVKNAIVTLHRSSIDGPLKSSESYMTTTQSDGTFSFQNLGPGLFVVCATVPGEDLLDPCQWSDDLDITRIAAPDSTAVYNVRLARGVPIIIRVEDPGGLLASEPSTTSGVLIMGVWTSKGYFKDAWRVASDPKGRDFRLVVPVDVDLDFAANTIKLELKDEQNVPFDVTRRVRVNLKPGQSKQFHFTVVGAP